MKLLSAALMIAVLILAVAGTLLVKPTLAEAGYYRRVLSPRGTVSPNETINLVFIIQQTHELYSLNDYVFTLDKLSDGRSVMFGDAWRNATMFLPDGRRATLTIEPETDMREMDCRIIEEVQVPYPSGSYVPADYGTNYTVWTIVCTASLGVLPVGWHHLIVYRGPYYQHSSRSNTTLYLAIAGSVFRVGLPIPPIKYRIVESTDATEPPIRPQTGFLGSSLPIEYGYGIVAVAAVSVVAVVGYLFMKRKKHGKDK